MPCPHGRRRDNCKECGGKSFCEHGQRRSTCKECGGSSICKHGRRRSDCKDCKDSGGGGGQVIFLEATEVEEIDEDDESCERLPTVQAHVVASRGGKRKR